MTENRTPFEIVTGLEGQDLADYRATKAMFHKNDPPFWICPQCKKPVTGKPDPGPCMECRDAKRAAKIKAWQDGEHKRRGDEGHHGGLADKVKAASEPKQEEQVRAGAELGYPDD